MLAEAAAGLASEQARYQEDATRALKRRCAAMLGLSLAEFSIIDSADHLVVSQVGRLGGLSRTNTTGPLHLLLSLPLFTKASFAILLWTLSIRLV